MFETDWDESVGLWGKGGAAHEKEICHLKRVHPGPDAAARLLGAAQLGRLRDIDVKRVLKSLRAMVWTADDPLYGCMKWYWEQDRPHDTNAAFFTGLPLVALRIAHQEKLDAEELADLGWMLEKLSAWFLRSCGQHHEYYPNKYLGDLVCAWLILECTGGDGAEAVAASMRRAATYWSGAGGWGWGEHLGGYINVLLDELSALLVLAHALPADIRAAYLAMLNELLAIQDAFGDGPPVPTIRSYAFTESPTTLPYRDYVRRWKSNAEIAFSNRAPLPDLLAERCWHDLVAPRAIPAASPTTVGVPCFNGAVGRATIDKDIRLGGLSRFPLMGWAEARDWGLSWQCFPVSLWRPGGDWGFLMWHATEDGVRRTHPFAVTLSAEIPRQLTAAVDPPIVGRTESLLQDGDLVAARFMPVRPASWTHFGDGFRLIRTTASAAIERSEGAWTRAVWAWPDRTVSVEFVNLTDDRVPTLQTNELGGYDFQVDYDPAGQGPALGVWRIRLSGSEGGAPVIEPADRPAQPRPAGGHAVRLRWSDRPFLVDPLAAPMIEERPDNGEGSM